MALPTGPAVAHVRPSVRVAALVLGLALSACGSPNPSVPLASETLPLTGALHLTTDPDNDPHDPLQLRYLDMDGVLVGERDSVDAETRVSLDRTLPVGRIQVVANDQACAGIVEIQAEVEIDAVLAVSDGTCTITIANTHAQGAIAHPEPRTALGAFVVLDSVLVVRPLDPGNAIAPIRRPADANAEVLEFEVPPGRYELSVLVNGEVLTTKEIDLKRGQDFYYNLRVLAANVPRVCGEIPRAQCEAAVTEAYASGLFPPPSPANLTSVRVRPSRYLPCYEAPAFDVLFDVRGEPGPIEVTVATTSRGILAVCTY